MKNLKTIISFMVLTMLIAVFPASSAVEAEQVSAPYEFLAYVDNISKDYSGGYTQFSLTSETYPSILYYDLDEGDGKEVLEFTVSNDDLEIADDNFTYSTIIYTDENNNEMIAWLGQPYSVEDKTGDWYLSELLIDEDNDDTILLEVGETLTLKEGVTVIPQEIDVDGGEAWFAISRDGEELDSTVL